MAIRHIDQKILQIFDFCGKKPRSDTFLNLTSLTLENQKKQGLYFFANFRELKKRIVFFFASFKKMKKQGFCFFL